jgi:hypothetical protein
MRQIAAASMDLASIDPIGLKEEILVEARKILTEFLMNRPVADEMPSAGEYVACEDCACIESPSPGSTTPP